MIPQKLRLSAFILALSTPVIAKIYPPAHAENSQGQVVTSEHAVNTPITAPVHTKHNLYEYTQYPVGSLHSANENSGYAALINSALSLRLLTKKGKEQSAIEASLKDNSTHSALFGATGLWRTAITEHRKKTFALDYIKDAVCSLMKHHEKLAVKDIDGYVEKNGFDEKTQEPIKLRLEDSLLIFDLKKFSTAKERAAIRAIKSLLQPTLQKLLSKQAAFSRTITNVMLTRAEIFDALEKAASEKKPDSTLNHDILNAIFNPFERISCVLEEPTQSGKLENALTLSYNNDSPSLTRSFNPQNEMGMAGDWLSIADLKALVAQEKENGTYAPDLKIAQRISYIDGSDVEAPESLLEMYSQYITLLSDFSKSTESKASTVFIKTGNEWISCVITKIKDKIYLVVTDAANKDRRKEPAIEKLIEVIKEGIATNKKPTDTDLLFDKENNSSKKEEETPISYDAPLATIPLNELPAIERFFGGTVPNSVKLRMFQLQRPAAEQRTTGTKIKNCLLLYGPPGTGKSTIAQIMARKSGWDIVYAAGGDFRTSFQGSANKLLNALVAEAKKRIAQGKRVVIFIDEIDGTTSKLEPRSSTEEDNRAIKTLIKILDQNLGDPNLFFMATTNRPDSMDPAIFRRFNGLEIPLPNYNQRKMTYEYYLDKNKVSVKDGDENAVTPEFLTNLISASEGLSNDAISDLINNAVQEAEAGFKPECKIGLGFRFHEIDLWNRPVSSNVLPLALSWLTPLAHYAGLFPNSEFDKHLYAQYVKQMKVKADIDRMEKLNDPERAARKDPFWKWYGKQTLNMINHGLVTKLTGVALLFATWKFAPSIGRLLGPNPFNNVFGNQAAPDNNGAAHDAAAGLANDGANGAGVLPIALDDQD